MSVNQVQVQLFSTGRKLSKLEHRYFLGQARDMLAASTSYSDKLDNRR